MCALPRRLMLMRRNSATQERCALRSLRVSNHLCCDAKHVLLAASGHVAVALTCGQDDEEALQRELPKLLGDADGLANQAGDAHHMARPLAVCISVLNPALECKSLRHRARQKTAFRSVGRPLEYHNALPVSTEADVADHLTATSVV